MEVQDYLETAVLYMKSMLIPIEGIHAYTPVEKKDETYTFHPYSFRLEYSSSYPDNGTYNASCKKQFDVFTPDMISFLNGYEITVTEDIEYSEKYYNCYVYNKYYLFKNVNFKTITTVTIDATNFHPPRYSTDGLGLSEQIDLIKKVYLDYLKIYSNMNQMYNLCKPKWFDKQLDVMKNWMDELINYLTLYR